MTAGLATLFARSWWQYDQNDPSWFSAAYHGFNLCEGAAWCVLAALVAARFIKHRRSKWEIAYSLAFVSFGVSDFREAYRLETWLIAAKFVNLVALLMLRSRVLKRFYPGRLTF
jgi:hypothetical protein